MNISTNYNQNFNVTGLNSNSIKNKQNQNQEQIKNEQNSNTMYIGKQGPQKKEDNRIEELTKRKEALEKRISELQAGQKLQGQTVEGANQLDPEAVKEKIKELQSSIKEIESTVASIKEEKKEENEQKNSSKDVEKAEQESIISSSMSIDKLKQQRAQQISMEGQSKILKTEIKQDKALKVDTSLKEEQLSNINSSIAKLDNSVGKEMKNIYRNLNSNKEKEEDNNLKVQDSFDKDNSTKAKESNYNDKLLEEYSTNTNMVKQESKSSVDIAI